MVKSTHIIKLRGYRHENYIVRIYRHDEKKPREFVGVVEEVGKDGRIAFTNYDELWKILSKKDQDAHRLSNLEER